MKSMGKVEIERISASRSSAGRHRERLQPDGTGPRNWRSRFALRCHSAGPAHRGGINHRPALVVGDMVGRSPVFGADRPVSLVAGSMLCPLTTTGSSGAPGEKSTKAKTQKVTYRHGEGGYDRQRSGARRTLCAALPGYHRCGFSGMAGRPGRVR